MFSSQVTKGEVVGEKVILTIEPAKGGPSETMEADVALVSIGEFSCQHMSHAQTYHHLYSTCTEL